MAKFEQNHKKLGGKKKGYVSPRMAFLKHTTDSEHAELLLNMAKSGDGTIAKAVGEWLWGKAAQTVDVTSQGERVGAPGVSVDVSKLKPDQIEALFEALGK